MQNSQQATAASPAKSGQQETNTSSDDNSHPGRHGLDKLVPSRYALAALFCYIDRDLGRPQWADVGMYLQTVMLLLRAEGLHSCPQMAWSQVRETVAEFLLPPDRLILFCGMSIGYEDPTVSYVRTGRAALNETVTFLGDSEIALRAPQLDQTNHLHLSQNESMVGLASRTASY